MSKLSCVFAIVLSLTLLSGCGRKKYETPIVSDSKQPDKTLFDKAVSDIEHSRYEVARLTLNTLINTYPDSEFLAKAKLGMGDAWYREGGGFGLTQAEAEYKDFITFFPMMPEAAEAQLKVAMIHYQQMEKTDRDSTHAARAAEEFKQLLLTYPDSPFKEEAEQRLREVQEVLAAHEFGVGHYYSISRENARAAIPRLEEVLRNYPNYSKADQAAWMIAESYEKGGKDFRPKAAQYYAKILSDYPLSEWAPKAKGKLEEWKMKVPEPNPEALARMKYDLEHRDERGFWGNTFGVFSKRPDVSMASKAGKPVLVPVQQQAGEELAVGSNPEPGALSITTVPPGTPAPTTPNAAPPAPTPATPPATKPPDGAKDSAAVDSPVLLAAAPNATEEKASASTTPAGEKARKKEEKDRLDREKKEKERLAKEKKDQEKKDAKAKKDAKNSSKGATNQSM